MRSRIHMLPTAIGPRGRSSLPRFECSTGSVSGAGRYRFHAHRRNLPNAEHQAEEWRCVSKTRRRQIQRRTDFDIPADRWPRYADAKFDNFEHGKCETSHPFCVDDQDLFIDGKYQLPAPSKMGLQPGSWYFDHLSNQLYLPSNSIGSSPALPGRQ